MTRASITAAAVLALAAGCAKPPPPRQPKPAADRAELEARYDNLPLGATAAQADAYLGARGAALVGHTTRVVRGKPDGADGAVAADESDRYWPSQDAGAAVRVVFGADGRVRLAQLLVITPTGPPPVPVPVEPPAP